MRCDNDEIDDFPSLPYSIRFNGIQLTGMSRFSLPAIDDVQTFYASVFVDGIECEISWDLTELTIEQTARMAAEWAALAEKKARTAAQRPTRNRDN